MNAVVSLVRRAGRAVVGEVDRIVGARVADTIKSDLGDRR